VASEDASDQGKKFRRKGRGLAYPGSSKSSGLGRRYLRSPARDFAGLAASRVREEKGKRRGERGLLIGMVGEPFPLRINKGEWGVIGGIGCQ
jgi:hypothetical protein